MDMEQIGRFLSELRKEQGLSQAELGEKLGVTNKTVSRWETGTYLPPAEQLLAMSELYAVSINEILSGKRLSDEEYRVEAEEHLSQMIRTSPFSVGEELAFYKKKWRKDHMLGNLVIVVGILSIFVVAAVFKVSVLFIVGFLLLPIAYGWRHNSMMAYAEQSVYDRKAPKTHREGEQ